MRKLLNKPWFVGLLAAAALAFVARSFLSARSATMGVQITAGAEAENPASGDESATADGSVSGNSPGAIRTALKELSFPTTPRDPFSTRVKNAPVTAAEKVPEADLIDAMTVSAIWIQGKTTYLLINQRVYQTGDHIGRLTLESANRDGVWVRHWKGRDFVALGHPFTLTTSAREAAALTPSSES